MSTAGTILLVALDDAFKQLVNTALREDSHQVIECSSGEQALQQYVNARPDLVLLDAELTGMNGVEICQHLIAVHGPDCAPIVFFATTSTPSAVAAGFAAGASDYLVKSSTTEEIRARVRSHLHNYVLLKQQKAMVEQLSRANAAKNRFVGMAAHDLRNPLASIRGFSEFLLDGTLGPMPSVQLALVSIIHGTSNVMIKTLNELLDVATIEAGQLKLQLSSHSLGEIVAKSIAQAKIEARKKRTRIDYTPSGESPVLTMDGDKVKQVVDNLLSNAIKFSPAASVITVTVDCGANGTTCGFAIRDQGPGMPATAQEKLQQRAGLAAEAPASDDKIAGLGLIICRNIVEAHQGRISAENLEKGCEVRVTLPLNP
jgi:signal transduction histidine kinase